MPYNNIHLAEVNCGFVFPEETTPWDSTFFGQFYEKIKEKGFTHREERKGVQITFPTNPEEVNVAPITTTQIEDQVVFRNVEEGKAIVIGKGKISFHVVKDYQGWELFLNDFIAKYFQIYQGLGLGNGKRQCSIVYLNRFNKKTSVNLPEYFNIVCPLDTKFGTEMLTFVQRTLFNKDNLLIAKLNSQIDNNGQAINLECGAVCISEECMKSNDWVSQANQTHLPILPFFEAVISEKLKSEL